jgi:hypothetical protein
MQTGNFLSAAALVTTIAFSTGTIAQSESRTSEVEAIAQEAFVYGLPMVMLYSIMNEYAINEDSGE